MTGRSRKCTNNSGWFQREMEDKPILIDSSSDEEAKARDKSRDVSQPVTDTNQQPVSQNQDDLESISDDWQNNHLLYFLSDEDIEETERRDSFNLKLRTFCCTHLNNGEQVADLLKLLGDTGKFPEIPGNIDELLETEFEMITPVEICNGKFLYMGIRNNLKKLYVTTSLPNPLKVTISWAGIRLFKTSQMQMWPLVIEIEDLHTILPIGVFVGPKHPKHPLEYFCCLMSELDEIFSNNGLVTVGPNHIKRKLCVTKFITAPPTNSWALGLGINDHKGSYSCNYCKPFINVTPFTKYVQDHTYSFPTDLMYVFDLGTTYSILKLLMASKTINVIDANLMIDTISTYVPSDFSRQLRRLDAFDRYKAIELHFFGAYCGPLILKACCDQQTYEHFLHYFIAYRIMLGKYGEVDKKLLIFADSCIKRFVEKFPNIYGQHNVSWDIHALLHVPTLVSIHGPINNLTCYNFGRYYMRMRQWIKKPSDVFHQIWQRWLQSPKIIKPKIDVIKFDGYTFNPNQRGDSCALLQDGTVIIITKQRGIHLRGKRFLTYSSWFDAPISSLTLNIYLVSNLSENEENIEPCDVELKMVMMPYQDKFLVMPLINVQR